VSTTDALSPEEATAPTNDVDPVLKDEIEKRRTFAIISHPDAGKTTLTEKLLLKGAPSTRRVRSRPARPTALR